MIYPKVLYRGQQYKDFMQMGRDIHANVMEHRYVNSEEEEIQAMEEGFGPLADFIGEEEIIGTQGSQNVEKISKPRGRPRNDPH